MPHKETGGSGGVDYVQRDGGGGINGEVVYW